MLRRGLGLKRQGRCGAARSDWPKRPFLPPVFRRASAHARLAGALLAGACLATVAHAQDHVQYERPVSAAPAPDDIGGGYTLPVVQRPCPRATWREALDVSILAGALGGSAWLVLRRRSRGGALALAVGALLYFGFYREGCVCPIGAIQNVAVALTDPAATVSYFTLAIVVLPLAAAVLFGRVFCSGVCPLGAMQELVLLRPVQIPRLLDNLLGWLKWIYLALALWFATRPAATRDFVICRYDPFVGFFRFTGPLDILLIGAALLLLAVFVGRPYCRWLCPYGGLLSLCARRAWRGVSITPDRELDCGLCAEACPYGAISGLRAVHSACLACARCYVHCPRQHASEPAQPTPAEAAVAAGEPT